MQTVSLENEMTMWTYKTDATHFVYTELLIRLT